MSRDTLVPYEFSDHTADILLTARGRSLPELFQNGARGVLAAVGKLRACRDVVEARVKLSAGDREELFHDFLGEVLFLFENRNLVVERVSFDLLEDRRLDARLAGGALDREASVLYREVKAVTYNELAVREVEGILEATVVLDI